MYPPGTQLQALFVPLNVHLSAFASSSSRTSTGRNVLRMLDPGAARSTDVAPQFENVPKRYFVNITNLNATSPYALVGIQMGYTYKPWNMSLYFQGANLANKSYISAVVTDDALGQSFYPGDGRGFYGGLQWRW